MTPRTEAVPTRPWRRARLLNAWIDDLTMAELIERMQGVVFTLNLDHLYLLQRDADFHKAYAGADFVTADSKYVFWSLGWIGRGIREKISGSDLVPAFCERYRADPDVRIFLLGAGPGVAELARRNINDRVGRDMVVRAHSPSMAFATDDAEIASVIAAINASGANVLVVGLGAPKQEIWIDRHRASLPGIRIFMGVGATIDYQAGTSARAPRWMGRIGMEWLYRAATQPKRYLRRYLNDTEFFWLLALDVIGRYRPPSFPERAALERR